jgi:tetratricopeptide (TPR) repeat protein
MKTSSLSKLFFSLLGLLSILVVSELPASANQNTAQFKKLNNQVVTLYKSKQYATALPFALEALQLMDHEYKNNPIEFAQALNNLGELKRKMGDPTTAEAMFLRSLNFSAKYLNENHPLMAIIYNNLALLYENQGNYPEAQSMYRRSLKIREQTLGSDHPAVAYLIHKISTLNPNKVSPQ